MAKHRGNCGESSWSALGGRLGGERRIDDPAGGTIPVFDSVSWDSATSSDASSDSASWSDASWTDASWADASWVD